MRELCPFEIAEMLRRWDEERVLQGKAQGYYGSHHWFGPFASIDERDIAEWIHRRYVVMPREYYHGLSPVGRDDD